MKVLIAAFLFLLFTACNEQEGVQPMQTYNGPDTTALSRPIELPDHQVTLVPAANEIAEDWLAYLTAQTEIENFNNYTVNDIISNATPIAEIMQNLRETLPARLQTISVETRLSVLYTKARVLEHLSRTRNIQPDLIKLTAEEIPVEFNNFKIQLNEIFLKTLEEFEDELETWDEDAEGIETGAVPREDTVLEDPEGEGPPPRLENINDQK